VLGKRLRNFAAEPLSHRSGRLSHHSSLPHEPVVAKDPKIPTTRFLLVAVVLLAFLPAGCRKKELNPAEVRAIADELASAAQGVAGPRAAIAVRPVAQPTTGSRTANAGYRLDIPLRDPGRETALVQALEDVAQKHDLTHGPVSSDGASRHFDLFHDSRRVYAIYITEAVAAVPRPRVALPSNAVRLSIIIDDLGEDIAPALEIFKMPYPLTVSIIPSLPNSKEIAEEAYRRGDEILLHFPMQASEAGAKPEPVELRVGMREPQVSEMLAAMLDTVPHASGVNNHQGSRATSDAALMDALMPALRERGLFFVDSRTTVDTVAYAAAERDGVAATFRSAQFLDDVESRTAILAQLDRAAADAKRKGWAVTIGHPHPDTIAALREGLPRLESRGIHLVFASDVAK